MRTRLSLTALTLLILLSLIVPAAAQDAGDRLQIVASYSILADVAANVAGDAADVTSLMPIGADPHGFTPSPAEVVMLAEADLVLVVGANFEESLNETITNSGEDMNIVTASDCVNIRPFGADEHDHDDDHDMEGEHADDHEGDEHADEHDDDHAEDDHDHEGEMVGLSLVEAQCAAHHEELEGDHEEHADDDHEHEEDHDHAHGLGMLYTLDCGGHHHDEEAHEGEHDHGACDPHVWTDPHNVMFWTLMIRDTLSMMDPANADTYAANAAAYIEELHEAAEFAEAQIATIPAENRKLVTNHLAFGYYADSFGLEMVGTVIPGGSTLAQPSAQEIAALIDNIRAEAVPAVFADSTANPDLAEQVAAETGADFYRLYTGSLTGPDGEAPTYLDYVRANTTIIVTALGGTPE
jgi:ABC-type Zn uptake system ZnuABC Zn-binding protein ZnuA